MATFPIKESDIQTLAQEISTGLNMHPTVFPAPPIPFADLVDAISLFESRRVAAVDKQAAYEQAIEDKNVALADLVEKMKAEIRYAENTVGNDDAKLKLIGWGAKKAPTALAAPGQCRVLEISAQGEGWITLDWKAPSDGGKVAAYNVERRQRPAGEWAVAGMAMETEITLTAQPRGVEWEYRIIAVNKAGNGPASNTVMAVL